MRPQLRASHMLIDTFRRAARTPYTHRRLASGRSKILRDPWRLGNDPRAYVGRGRERPTRISKPTPHRLRGAPRLDVCAAGQSVRKVSGTLAGRGAQRRPSRDVPATGLREDGVVHEVVYAAERLRIHALVLFQPHASCTHTPQPRQSGRSHRHVRKSTKGEGLPAGCRQGEWEREKRCIRTTPKSSYCDTAIVSCAGMHDVCRDSEQHDASVRRASTCRVKRIVAAWQFFARGRSAGGRSTEATMQWKAW